MYEILHCNYDDVQNLQNIVDSMTIKGKPNKPAFHCAVYLKKFRSDKEQVSWCKSQSSFTTGTHRHSRTNNKKNKSDTVEAAAICFADTAPYWKVKCLRSDNGAEFRGNNYQGTTQ